MMRVKEETIHQNNIQLYDILKIRAVMNILVNGVIIRRSGIDFNKSAIIGESNYLNKDTMESLKSGRFKRTQIINI